MVRVEAARVLAPPLVAGTVPLNSPYLDIALIVIPSQQHLTDPPPPLPPPPLNTNNPFHHSPLIQNQNTPTTFTNSTNTTTSTSGNNKRGFGPGFGSGDFVATRCDLKLLPAGTTVTTSSHAPTTTAGASSSVDNSFPSSTKVKGCSLTHKPSSIL